MTLLPSSMTAISIRSPGGPEELVAETRPIPVPGPDEVLIRVAAAGINRPDVLQRKGLYPAPKGHSELPGLEVSGTIVGRGDRARRFADGERVMALVNGGGYAEYALAHEGSTLPVPQGVSLVEAAGIPETFFTVWHNVFQRGQLKPGEWLLVHGGTSGIGVTAIQLATALGAKVITTAGSPEKCEAARGLGAVRAVDYSREDFNEAVKSETQGRGVDVILDMVGGDYVERNLRALADDGRLVYIGFQSGSKVSIDLMRLMLKRLTLTGSTLRIRSNDIKAAIARAVEAEALPLVGAGRVRIVVDRTFPLAAAADAHRRMESGGHIGKIILEVAP